MMNISGYREGADVDSVEKAHRLTVNCCGHYRLLKRPRFETVRPQGRRDYQLLYLAGGTGHFEIGGKETAVHEGTAVLFLPGQTQRYRYSLEEQPDVYWIHFSGTFAPQIPEVLGIPEGGLCQVGIYGEYTAVFEHVIRELQMKRPDFESLCALYAEELVLLMKRHAGESGVPAGSERVQEAVELMNRDFAQERSVAEYARLCGVGTCWFIRSFREHMGMPPQQFVIRLRVEKAKELLRYSSYNIGEIASLVGYENPLYFSRVFRGITGMPPREYRFAGEKKKQRPPQGRTL